MVKKINVSISDALAERSEKWKGKYSPSELYQKALEDFVSKKEQLEERLKGEPEMEAQTIERLKAQKKASETAYLEAGKQEGARWARNADYTDLKYAANVFDPRLDEPLEDNSWNVILRNQFLGEYFKELLGEHPEFVSYDHFDNCIMEEEGCEFLTGWLEAVEAFWEKVSAQLDN